MDYLAPHQRGVVMGQIADINMWVVANANVDAKVENGPEEKSESALEKALTRRQAIGKRKENEEELNILLSGSLYLIADCDTLML